MSRLVLKSPTEIEVMDEANCIIHRTLDALGTWIRPGITTMEVNEFVDQRIAEAGAIPAFKGYPHPSGGPAFPGSACTSVNSEVVHGIPSETVMLQSGDIVSVDVGVLYRGFYGDSARTFAVGAIADPTKELLTVTAAALDLGVAQARAGNRVSDIGHAVQTHVESHGFSVVREFVGHGIGADLHEDPQVPNFGPPGRGPRLDEGMVLAIEPMVNAGRPEVGYSDDRWTTLTRDGSLSAHFECCVAITADGPRVLGRDVNSTVSADQT